MSTAGWWIAVAAAVWTVLSLGGLALSAGFAMARPLLRRRRRRADTGEPVSVVLPIKALDTGFEIAQASVLRTLPLGSEVIVTAREMASPALDAARRVFADAVVPVEFLHSTANFAVSPKVDNLVEAIADALDLGGLDLEVGDLTLVGAAGARLVDQDRGVRQRRTLARGSAGEKDRRRRGRLTEADGHDVTVHVLHRVVDGEHVGHAATGRVDVHGDVAVGIQRLEHQQLGHDVVGNRLVDRRAQEHDPLFEQLRVRVVLSLAVRGVLDERRQDVAGLRLHSGIQSRVDG